jgi:TolB-like protein
VAKKLDLGTVVPLGKPKLKNIAERFAVYALLPEQPKGMRQQLYVQRLKLSRRIRPVHWLSVAGLLLVVGTLLTVHYLPLLQFLLSPPRPFAPNTQPLTETLPLPEKPSLIVLPFANMSNDPSQDYFSDGITEDITTDLSRLSSLFVISRNTAFVYKGRAVKLADLSKELGVQYVLEGSVRRADGQVRITAQLIDATQDRHVWAERYDRPLKDIRSQQCG